MSDFAKFLESFYRVVGYNSAKYPRITLGLTVLITAVCSVGFMYVEVQNDPQKIWVSPESRSYKEQQYFNDKFGKFFRIEQVIFKHKHDPSSTDIFQKEYLKEVWKLQSQIESATILYEDSIYTVDNYCYKPINGKGCFISSPMDYWKMNITKLEEDPDIKATAQCNQQVKGEQIVCSDRNEIPIIRDVVFGGISCEPGTTTECEACKINAHAMMITFLMNDNHQTHKDGVKHWEAKIFEDKIDDFNDDHSHNLKAVYMSQRSIPDELDKEAHNNFSVVIMSYAFMFLYISLAIGEFPSKLHTRFLVGFGGIFIVICSLLISIGVASWAGVELTLISSEVVPFLILAIGVDNMFIISMTERTMKKKWRRKYDNAQYNVPKILGKTIGHVGPGIMAAAVSEAAAFIVGVMTQIPALAEFCIIAAAAVLVDFILQNTAFVSILALDNERIKQKRLDVVPCFDLTSDEVCPDREWVRTFVKRWFAPALYRPLSQFAVALTFVALIFLSFGSYSHYELGLNEKATLIQGSNLYDYFDALNKYGEAGPPAYLVFKNLNYTNQYNRDALDKLSSNISM